MQSEENMVETYILFWRVILQSQEEAQWRRMSSNIYTEWNDLQGF